MTACREPSGVWEWDVVAPFNPTSDAVATPMGLRYGCEIQGPFCGWDSDGTQSWESFLRAEIRAYALVFQRYRVATIGDKSVRLSRRARA